MEKRSPAPPGAGARGRPAGWVLWLAAGTLGGCGYLALPAGPGADALYALLDLGCAAAVVVGVRVHRPAVRTPWYLLATGQLLLTCGDLGYRICVDVLHRAPVPSPAEVCYLGAYPMLAAAVHLLTRRRGPGGDRGALLDGALLTSGLALLAWIYLIEPATADHPDGLLPRLLSPACPLADLVVLALVLRLLGRPGPRPTALRLLTASLVLLLLADAALAALTTAGRAVPRPLELGGPAAALLWTAAALHPSMRTLAGAPPGPEAALTRRRLTLLTGAALLAPAVLFAEGASGRCRIDWLAVSIGSAVLFLLVLTRVSYLTAQVQGRADQLAALASSDGLTGIPNRRAWDGEVARQLAEAARTGAPVCVALLDLDRFKRFNDAHGHPAGDRLLRGAAAAWQRQLRPGDLLARYGGEEFGVLTVGLNATGAAALVDRLRRHTPLGQTLSAGVARWDGTETAQALLGRADRALYRAKRAGRDRVVVADGKGLPGGEAQRVTSEQE
ncbi:GGDEF domain-containing protein [Streptomyces sp. NPDC092296]|uniref:sensor domain-containing diguanylate cyclase n=1 Tax=Streptomyces sp. NPDC092296 TaxID=3366012 RepID=UPI00381E043A